jgi:hypothetical protein
MIDFSNPSANGNGVATAVTRSYMGPPLEQEITG